MLKTNWDLSIVFMLLLTLDVDFISGLGNVAMSTSSPMILRGGFKSALMTDKEWRDAERHDKEIYKELITNPGSVIHFHLFTRLFPYNGEQLFVGNPNKLPLDPRKPVVLYIHGFDSSFFTERNLALRDALLKMNDLNVIGVDWSRPADGPFYNFVRNRINEVADYIIEFYRDLEYSGVPLGNIYCIGHSLGAHICGLSGKNMNGALGRITGLEPALPLFDYDEPEERLANTDAVFVDVIHTSGGTLGFLDPLGDADFYPNGGTPTQPGCGFDFLGSCSHSRVIDLYTESIGSLEFIAHTRCEAFSFLSYCPGSQEVVMGYHTPPSTRGNFYLQTASTPPYALGLTPPTIVTSLHKNMKANIEN